MSLFMRFDTKDIEKFDKPELDTIAYSDEIVCYLGTRDLELTRAFYDKYFGNKPNKLRWLDEDPVCGIEFVLEVEKETGAILYFAVSLVEKYEDGESSLDPVDIWDDRSDVAIKILEMCGADKGLVELVRREFYNGN